MRASRNNEGKTGLLFVFVTIEVQKFSLPGITQHAAIVEKKGIPSDHDQVRRSCPVSGCAAGGAGSARRPAQGAPQSHSEPLPGGSQLLQYGARSPDGFVQRGGRRQQGPYL